MTVTDEELADLPEEDDDAAVIRTRVWAPRCTWSTCR